MRVVVVGAGPAGVIALRTLQKQFGDYTEAEATEKTVQYVCYERRQTVGGEWVLTDSTQAEKYDSAGIPLSTSVYKELKMNSPTIFWKPHPDHSFPAGVSLYPTQQDMCNYLQSFAAKFKFDKYVRFGKPVSEINYKKGNNNEPGHFVFKVTDLTTGQVSQEQCDYMIMCVGQYSVPRIPDHVNFSEFKGETMHYHWLRDPARLNDKRILIVGSSWSAMDMVIMLNRPGRAAKMYVSYNQSPPLWAKSVQHQVLIHPKVTKIAGNTVTFADGVSVELDVIVFCSGFKHVHPLHDDLQLDFNQSRFLFPLYKHVVHPKCPSLFFLGKANTLGLFMMRPQAEFACAVMQGRVKLPSESEMLQDIKKFQTFWTGELAKIYEVDYRKYFPIGEIELAQAQAVIDMAGCEQMEPAGYFRQSYYEFISSLLDDPMNFKNYQLEFRDDPKKPGQKIGHLVPPTVDSKNPGQKNGQLAPLTDDPKKVGQKNGQLAPLTDDPKR